MKRARSNRPHGQLRQSQVIKTFGPGAMLDLPNRSVIVGGLEFWGQPGVEIHEPRLIAKLERLLDRPGLRLFAPPLDEQDPTAPPTGITAFQFPEWFVTQDVDEDKATGVRSRHLVPRKALDHRGKFVDDERKARPVVPVRFVRACRRGHIGDIDWYVFAHGHRTDCRRGLRMEERGTSGDLSEISIRCDCGAGPRQLLVAASHKAGLLGHCDGKRPWLGAYAPEVCEEANRLLVRTATHAYFSQTISVISLPASANAVTQAVDRVWQHYLEFVENAEHLASERRKPVVAAALAGFTDDQVLAEIRRRRAPDRGKDVPVKQAEVEVLLSSKEEIGVDHPDGTFYARSLPREKWEAPGLEAIDRVVLLHRLREVVAQVGFTRFEAISPDIEGELELGVERAQIAREADWLPAIETRGEGFFLAFRREAVDAWAKEAAVQDRGGRLLAGFQAWQHDHTGSHRRFPGIEYIMLHTLSHLLLTVVSLECGYPASSIRERVYAGDRGYGILLYTATSDAEGTLGGLVEAARSIRGHLSAALELGRLCSNDPVCAQHEPDNTLERRFLLGAACHGCVLISETSCEQANDLLDRALVVPTLADSAAAFFKDPNV